MVHKPFLGLSHGSRAQMILCRMLNIPSILIADYEHAKFIPFERPSWVIAPDVIPKKAIHCAKQRILLYPGIKEDVYVPYFRPDPLLAEMLGLDMSRTIVTVRPPATEAHYHNPQSEVLLSALMKRLYCTNTVQVVILPRKRLQARQLRAEHPDWFENGKVIIPGQAIDGLNLIWHSDLVVSGGGTDESRSRCARRPGLQYFQRQNRGCRPAPQFARQADPGRNRGRHPQNPTLPQDREAKNHNGQKQTIESIITHIEHIFSLTERSDLPG